MLLVIDIGNTNVVVGFMKSESDTVYTGRLETLKNEGAALYETELRAVFADAGIRADEIDGVVVSSVVPEITNALFEAARRVTGRTQLVINNRHNTGITIAIDEPDKVGADLIVGAVGACAKYDGALAVFDLGTATTLIVIDKKKTFLGGLIIPGIKISLNAMTSGASQLFDFELKDPENFIGKNTGECLQCGLVNGTAAMRDDLTHRVEAQLGEAVTPIVTGGLGGVIYKSCMRKMNYEPDLLMRGLWHIYKMNCED